MAIINTNLMKHPANWFIVVLMLVIAGMAGHLVLSFLGIEPKTAES